MASGRVILRLEGLPGSVALRAKALGAALAPIGSVDVTDDASDFSELRDYSQASTGPLWRIVLRPSQAPALLAQLPGRQAIDWGGALIWAEAPADWRPDLPPGTRATCVAGAPAQLPPADPVTARLQAGLRAAFDPRGLFGGGP